MKQTNQTQSRRAANRMLPVFAISVIFFSIVQMVSGQTPVLRQDNESPTLPVWFNETHCNGIHYQYEPEDNIEEAIPLAWLEYISIHLKEELLSVENYIKDTRVILLKKVGEDEPIQTFKQTDHVHPEIPENEIWLRDEFRIEGDEDITAGTYEVFLRMDIQYEEYVDTPEYLLGGFTLEKQTVYPIIRGERENGAISMNKEVYRNGDQVTVWVLGSPGYTPDEIRIYKTGEEPEEGAITFEKTPYTGSASCTFTMPGSSVTVEATFKSIASEEDIQAVQTALNALLETGGARYTLVRADAGTSEAVKTPFAALLNGLIPASTGITATADHINITHFTAATEDENGIFSYSFNIPKGGAYLSMSGSATILCSTYYGVIIAGSTGGKVTSSDYYYEKHKQVELTVTPDEGYELEAISAYKSTDTSEPVALEGTAGIRLFNMPSYNVTILATFKIKAAADEEDIEAVEAAKTAIEEAADQFAEVDARAGVTSEAALETWIINMLKAILGEDYTYTILRSDSETLAVEVKIDEFTAPIAGTPSKPKGTNGSYTFTVTLSRGEAKDDTFKTSGIIQATPYTSETPETPEKSISLKLQDELTARISNTGDISTGKLTLELSGDNADAFTLSASSVDNLDVAATTEITLTPRSDLPAGDYKVTLTVSGTGLTSVSVEFTYSVNPTGINEPQSNDLQVYVRGGTLYISGLTAGQHWSVYTLSGILVSQGIAGSNEVKVNLSNRGMYIIKSGSGTVKALY